MTEKQPLDRISFEILRLLAKNARLTNKELAAAVGLAPSTCHERLKQLTEAGLLRGAHADIDLRKLGVPMEALVHVELAKHKRNAVDSFAARLLKVPEVRQIFLLTGRFDLLVHLAIRDMEHLKDLAYEHFTSAPSVIRIETSVVFQSWAKPGRLPLAEPTPSPVPKPRPKRA